MKNKVWLKISTPQELHKKFKTACWLNNTSMKDRVLKMMNQMVTVNKDQIEEAEKVRNS